MSSSILNNSDSSSSRDSIVEVSPGMTKYYIPHCNPSLKLHVGQFVDSLPNGEADYKKYALACGFDVRLGTTKKSDDGKYVLTRYCLCSREGSKVAVPDEIDDDGSPIRKRRTVSMRVQCKARIIFAFAGSRGYVVKKFIERHTHMLVPEAYRHFMKMSNTLDYGHKKFVLKCAQANIGPMKSFKILKEIAGSYSNVGVTSKQVANFSTDMKAYAAGSDAQMIIDKLKKKCVTLPGFFYAHEVNETDHLKSLFWADPIARRNFCAFGDVISFDATYSTNKHHMIFAPFTGKDNHGKCITLGAALLTGESIEDYAWVFEQFKKCMGHGPNILMTDQDPAIKIAVARVFIGSRHRLCMWHIMSKVPERAPRHLRKDPDFMKQLTSVVWSIDIDHADFERRWKQTMTDFGLADDKWFKYMFQIRDSWIPAYFRDFPMGGLFRTTSPSESENSFFRIHMNSNANLVEFFMHFDNAIDSQRHTQSRLNIEGLSCCHDMKTSLLLEKHAASVYTRQIFNEVQEDIMSAFYKCHLQKITDDESRCLYEVEERGNGVFSVAYDKVEKQVVCSCKKFVRIGLVCCHIFFVFKDLNLDTIPEKYIVSRWTKLALTKISSIVCQDVADSCDASENNRLFVLDLISEFYSCLDVVADNHEATQSLFQSIRDVKDRHKPGEDHVSAISAKKRLFEDFYSTPLHEQVIVKPPLPVSNKGSGSRIESRRAAAIRESLKPLRLCRKCNTMCHHDSRNCNKQV